VSLAGVPQGKITVPSAIWAIAHDREIVPAWENLAGGLTFFLHGKGEDLYAKWMPVTGAIDLGEESARLEWARPHTPVPEVLEVGHDNEGSWLVTRAIDAKNAVAPEWIAEPEVAVRAIGVGLRQLHERLPREECPFSWSRETRLASALSLIANRGVEREALHELHTNLSDEEIVEILTSWSTDDDLVVCHGDACAPNTLLDKSGLWCAHVDFGCLGVADRWADLSVASWSTQWNYGPGWERILYDAYEIEPVEEKIRFYRLLWDVSV